MKAEELYELLKESELMNLRFSGLHKVGDFDINLDRANVIGNIMQEWLEGWLKKNDIEYSPNENTQMPPDVFLNPDDKTKDLL